MPDANAWPWRTRIMKFTIQPPMETGLKPGSAQLKCDTGLGMRTFSPNVCQEECRAYPGDLILERSLGHPFLPAIGAISIPIFDSRL